MSSWVILTFASLGVAAAIVAFVKTPPDKRFRAFSQIPLEEKLRNYSPAVRAVIIRGDKKHWLKKNAAGIAIGIIVMGFLQWSKQTDSLECITFMGFSAVYIVVILLCYGMPLGFLIASLVGFRIGKKVISTGYFPPLDSIVFSDVIAKKGLSSMIRGIVLLVLPIFTLVLLYLGNSVYGSILGDASMHEIQREIMIECQDGSKINE